MADATQHTGTQGGTHQQHVDAGKQSHKNAHEEEDTKIASTPTGHHHALTKEEDSKGGKNSHGTNNSAHEEEKKSVSTSTGHHHTLTKEEDSKGGKNSHGAKH